MKTKNTTVATLALCAALPLAAQFGGPPPGFIGGGPGRHEFGAHKVVKGAPYSATVTNTIVQRLADGNTIQRTTTGQVARDSLGRTYEQETISGGPLGNHGPKNLTFLADPVAGYAYVLDANKKTAFRRPFHPAESAAGAPGPEGEAQRHWDSSKVTKSDLGSDSSSGVAAQGTNVVHTIPAGEIGNTAPIVSTVQTWYSSDLQIVVKSVRNDPRFGQSTFALSNVSTKEPDASLFQVPAGYSVQDALMHGPHGHDAGPPPPLP
ncbi:MAG: hypothetical protein JO061_03655 [Acidobacteriaceae bacterium]|nr:hypothetical protein [Acidobacteriaceae bacterium]